MSLSELKQKDVVNILDGRRLGRVIDLEFRAEDGCVEALVVPGETKVGNLLRGERCGIVIPWCKIIKIGENVILVQLDQGDLAED